MEIFETFAYAFFTGLFPALIWLWFWLHEDKKHPEPRSILALTFTTGMAMIFFAIPLESLFQGTNVTLKFTAWAAIEEILKFAAAYLAAIHTKAFDEPLDAIIYLMCAALGFAALENTLFILNISPALPSSGSLVMNTVFLTNLRFIGANLLHVIASSAIGISLAYSFTKSRKEKIFWVIGGVISAIALHTVFNLLIMDGNSSSIFLAFAIVWLVMIAFVLVFEKIKKICPTGGII